MEELRPNKERAQTAIILIWVMLVLDVASLISGYFQYDLLQTRLNGGTISADVAYANDVREQILAVVSVLAFVISVITFIRWFRRAYYNLHLRVKFLLRKEGWAAGSWFVPIMCLILPYKIMEELYKETKTYLSNKGSIVSENFSTEYLSIWWALWVINNLVGQFVFRSSMRAVTIEELSTVTKFGMVANLVGIPLAWITIKVIRDYANVESAFAEIKEDQQTSIEGSEIE